MKNLLGGIAVATMCIGSVVAFGADQDIIVDPGQTLEPNIQWVGGTDVNLTLKTGSTLRFLPNSNPNTWAIILKSLTIENDVVIDLSGTDNAKAPKPSTPPKAPSGHAGGNGMPGYDGSSGINGGHATRVSFNVGNLKIGSVRIVRYGGNGGPGGNGGDGGNGGAGDCFHKGGDGGWPGIGGKGGSGGNVTPFSVLYTTFIPTSGAPPTSGPLLPGVTDDQRPGKGGPPGEGGVSTAGSGCAGSGQNYDYRNRNHGRGLDGETSIPVEFIKKSGPQITTLPKP